MKDSDLPIYKICQIAAKYGMPPRLNEKIDTAYEKLLLCVQAMDRICKAANDMVGEKSIALQSALKVMEPKTKFTHLALVDEKTLTDKETVMGTDANGSPVCE